MQYNFDQIIERRNTECLKWGVFAPDVIPMWVADMDFISPEPVIRTLHDRTDHGVFGYPYKTGDLSAAIVAWLAESFGWKTEAEWLVFLPGVVVGMNLTAQALMPAGMAVACQTPVYPPFLSVGRIGGMETRTSPLCRDANGRYTIDWEAFEASLDQCGMFLLCSPHNPVGRVWERNELERLAEICLRKNVLICSDEIHADLVYAPNRHIPIAALDGAVSRSTVTLMAPSKTFNIPGLGFSFAVIEDPDLRKRFQAGRRGLIGEPNLLGMAAATAAYRGGREWLDQVLVYLRDNRDFLAEYIRRELPELPVTIPEGTYLAWVDCRGLDTQGQPASKFVMDNGRVAFNDGAHFGPGGDGFIRINFACPRETLVTGLERLRNAVRGG